MAIAENQLETPYTAAEKSKLGAIPSDAAALPTQVSSGEKTAGTETGLRSFAPKDVKDMAVAFGGGSSGVTTKQSGTTVTTGATTLNFTGSGVTVTDAGGGTSTVNIPGGGGGTTLQRYVASSTSGEEVEVFATNTGITYARSGTTGTFTIPNGVRLLGARLRLPMGTIGGFSFTVNYATNGGSDGNTSFTNMYPPLVQAWREDTGAQVAISSTIAPSSTFTETQVTGLSGGVTNSLRLQW